MTTINIGDNGPYRRRCESGILESHLTYTFRQESPIDFHIWVCLSMIACALGRNCWCDIGIKPIYPNMYIILVGESALTHKSTAIHMGMNPFQEALPDVPYLGDCMTAQALVSSLAELSTEEQGGKAEGILEASELSVMLGNSKLDDTFIKRLTDLWDCPNRRVFRTIGRGKEEVKDVCLNLIGGSTPKWLRSSVPEEALEGGFFSRLILVYRPPKGEKNPFPMLSDKQRQAIEDVKNDLKCIRNNMNGCFHIEPRAMQYLEEWYHDHNHPERAESFMRGYYGRKGDFMLKISMCISASFSDDMVITLEDMIMAHKLLNENEEYSKSIVKYMGTTEVGAKNIMVLAYIRKGIISVPPEDTSGYTAAEIKRGLPLMTVKGIGRSELMRRLGNRISKEELDLCLETLAEGEEIRERRVGPKGARVYVYIGGDNTDID